jgi:hypothetical protein
MHPTARGGPGGQHYTGGYGGHDGAFAPAYDGGYAPQGGHAFVGGAAPQAVMVPGGGQAAQQPGAAARLPAGGMSSAYDPLRQLSAMDYPPASEVCTFHARDVRRGRRSVTR